MSTVEVSYPRIQKNEFTDGISVTQMYYNAGEKDIKYLTFQYSALNRVDDVVGCRVSQKKEARTKVTGPIKAKTKSIVEWDTLWYNSTITKVVINEIFIQFIDGTEEVIAGEDVTYWSDKDGAYNKESAYYNDVVKIEQRRSQNYQQLKKARTKAEYLVAVENYKDNAEDFLTSVRYAECCGLEAYYLGDAIETYFPDNEELMRQAVSAWKTGVSRQREYYQQYKEQAKQCVGFPEKYTEKIKKYEPAYVMPKKPGCMS